MTGRGGHAQLAAIALLSAVARLARIGRRPAAVTALAAGLTLGFGVSAFPPASTAAQEIEVALVSPEPGQPIFGPTTVAAEVYPLNAEVEKVEFFLDGFQVGVDEAAPFEILIDAGRDNATHVIEAVAHGLDGATASARLSTPAIQVDDRVDVELRQLYISFEDEAGANIQQDFSEEDFIVLDEGMRQEIVTFESGDVPFSAVLLLDASLSMRGDKLATALAAARNFVGRLNQLDEAKLILFSDRVLHETPFTNFASVLTLGLSGATAQGGSAINDALYLAHKRLEPRQGRKVIFLLSDGVDIESILSMDKVRWLSQRHEAALYWVRMGSREDSRRDRQSSWRDAPGHRREREELEATVAESGGRILSIGEISALENALRQLLDELRSQYVIGYYPASTKGPGAWHQIEVRVEGRSRGVRTRRGYLEF